MQIVLIICIGGVNEKVRGYAQIAARVGSRNCNATWANDQVVENKSVQVWGTQISNASSLLSDEIEFKQADHLSDLLRDQPGVNIGGAHSTNQRINIRGMQDLDMEVTIDGARQNNFMYHHMGNLLINADILKAVDLQVGNNSVLHGGLAGGVAFETKDAKDLLSDGQQVGATSAWECCQQRLLGLFGYCLCAVE